MSQLEVTDYLKLILDEAGLDNTTEVIDKSHVADISTMKYLVEGVIMMTMGMLGIFLNMFAVIFFIRQRTQKSFHR